MKVSWFWLSQILDLSLTNVSGFEKSLTVAGFEIDDVRVISSLSSQNVVFNIIPIPNRYDLLSMIGIAREAAVVSRQNLKFSFRNVQYIYNKKKEKTIKYSGITNCACCSTILLRNTEVKASPKWLQDYLILLDVQPINNIIDIKNYIKIKWGQDIQIFDISDLYLPDQEISIIVKSHQQKNLFVDVKDGTRIQSIFPINLQNTFIKTVSSKMNNIVRPMSVIIIQAVVSDSLDLTEIFDTSTIKQVNNLEDNILFLAMQESIFLYKKFCHALVEEYSSLKNNQDYGLRLCIKLTKNNLARILSPTIKHRNSKSMWEVEVTKILDLLNLSPVKHSTYWLTNIPKQRQYDLKREVDLIEEIARIYGFHHFDNILPYACKKKRISLRELLKRQIRSFLRNVGLHELVHSSLQKQQQINIFNPLSDEFNGLRSNLVVGLIETLYYNIDQSNDNFDGFEIGKVFCNTNTRNVVDGSLHVGMIWSCQNYLRSNWSDRPTALSWLQAKGMVSNLCQSIGVTLSWDHCLVDSSLKKITHNTRTAILYFGRHRVGFFGEVSSQLSNDVDRNQTFYVCELDLDTIIHQLKNSYFSEPIYQMKPYSRYPCVTRDISMIIGRNISTNVIMKKINSVNKPFVKSIELFDEYLGSSIPTNKRSVSLRVIYQSPNATLTNVQITQLHNKMTDIISKELDIEIR